MSEKHPPQQSDRLATRAVIGTIVVALLVIVGVLVVSAWVTPPKAGGIVLQHHEGQDLSYRFEDPGHPPREIRRALAAQLETYGWVDREAGIVHVPVRLGMELYLETAPQEGE